MKARLPEGVGRGPGNMQSMICQAQKMQEEIDYRTQVLRPKLIDHLPKIPNA